MEIVFFCLQLSALELEYVKLVPPSRKKKRLMPQHIFLEGINYISASVRVSVITHKCKKK